MLLEVHVLRYIVQMRPSMIAYLKCGQCGQPPPLPLLHTPPLRRLLDPFTIPSPGFLLCVYYTKHRCRVPMLDPSHSTQLRRNTTNPTTQQTELTSAFENLRCQIRSRSLTPINVTFPQCLVDLPREQLSSEVLTSLGLTSEVLPQYIRDQMEHLGPM
jgi:hypothetical protein